MASPMGGERIICPFEQMPRPSYGFRGLTEDPNQEGPRILNNAEGGSVVSFTVWHLRSATTQCHIRGAVNGITTGRRENDGDAAPVF